MIKMALITMIEADNLPIVPVKIQGYSDNNTKVADTYQLVARTVY
jgi:1-acyl-sn-glycerol-3-phosphate acyltransferase